MALSRPSGMQSRSVSRLVPRASTTRPSDWRSALSGGDDGLLAELVANEPPGESLFELETYINGSYRGFNMNRNLARAGFPLRVDVQGSRAGQMATLTGEPAVAYAQQRLEAQVGRVIPVVQSIRDRLGWDIREFDLQLLRSIRQSSCLSIVLGAGASCAEPCGAPSWPVLVKELLQASLDRGLTVPVRVGEEEEETPGQTLGQAAGSWTRTIKYEQTTVKEYNKTEKAQAREYIRRIDAKEYDAELLSAAASLIYSLCGQHLFTYITAILYRDNRQPSAIHRAVARLARSQHPDDRNPGLDAIITYNFDDFMSQALRDDGVPSAVWAMRGNEMAIDPDTLAERLGQSCPQTRNVLHLHGYTPRRMFDISLVRYVFATPQYTEAYGQESELPIFDKFISEHLENPIHVALYVGCSFIDPYMNLLLERAISRSPGRYHYALLRWPRDRNGVVPSTEELRAEQATYLRMGVRPVWFDEFSEIPGLLARLE